MVTIASREKLRLERVNLYSNPHDEGAEYSIWKVYGQHGEAAVLRGRFDGIATCVDCWTFSGWVLVMADSPEDTRVVVEVAAGVVCGRAEEQIEFTKDLMTVTFQEPKE